MSSNIRIIRICQFCYKEFTAKTTKTKFCSLSCASKSYKRDKKEKLKEVAREEREALKSSRKGFLEKLDFFTIDQAVEYTGFSRRTLYRLNAKSELEIVKNGYRSIIYRSAIEQFLESLNTAGQNKQDPNSFPGIENCYTIGEAQKRFNVSPAALYNMIQSQGIKKYCIGKFVHVAQSDLDLLFNVESHG
ncbi:excisionase family DNA binding protein [Flavobacterium nitrogenifigens]|uniref:Excisionase family DNA binding protein n=2 Tax=Flavobacterium TaxID=237 RepID=A0A7W7IX02_9FLAO|nr:MULTISPECIES: helix-turn-helix domain-containing protein [Flavobacterium]MBB4802154.1 excisionase family DNA binding protein [Flavobacterium nitrogenifigens]MBB6387112.1 excisionase family DNA binding protein [Flavobacterium notoginsengisoli]